MEYYERLRMQKTPTYLKMVYATGPSLLVANFVNISLNVSICLFLSFFLSLDGEENTVLLYLPQNNSIIDVKGSQFAWQGKGI